MAEVQIQRAASLRDQVVNAVLGLLQAGELIPGSRVTELGLARKLNVSRTPIREALGQLSQRGALQQRNGGGYVVPIPSDQEIRDVIAVRLLLEPSAARIAAEEYDESQIEEIDRAIAGETEASAERNPQHFAQANEAFRQAVFGSLPNKALRDAIWQFNAHLHFIRATTLKDVKLRKEIVQRQRQIRDAIAQRDPDMAEALWKSYLRLAEDVLLRALHQWNSDAAHSNSAASAPLTD